MRRPASALAVMVTLALAITACANNNAGSSGGASSGASVAVPNLTVTSFDASFSAMSQLTDVVKAGHGKVAVILPDTTSSARYTAYDLPYLTKAFQGAGYSSSDFSIQNAQGTTTTELAVAQAAISGGATVLLVDPIDSATGKQIQAAAQQAGIPMISYDRATFQGDKTYYVSFDNVQVGELIGKGFTQCVSD